MQYFALCLVSPAQVVDSKTRNIGAEVALTRVEMLSVDGWVSDIIRRVPLES
jgi:hypothetical protein